MGIYVWYSHQRISHVEHSPPKSLLWFYDEKGKLDSNTYLPLRSFALLHRKQSGPTETPFLYFKLLSGKALPKQHSETVQGLGILWEKRFNPENSNDYSYSVRQQY